MPNEHAPPEPRPIPDSPDFPVTWENPDDARLPWEYDATHFTGPVPYLESQAFWAEVFVGFNA